MINREAVKAAHELRKRPDFQLSDAVAQHGDNDDARKVFNLACYIVGRYEDYAPRDMPRDMMNENQTLKQWQQRGGNGLSHSTEASLCQVLKCRPRDLDDMTLASIFAVPDAGEMAQREIIRFHQTQRHLRETGHHPAIPYLEGGICGTCGADYMTA